MGEITSILELTVILRPLEPRPKSDSDTPLLAHISLANISSVKLFPFFAFTRARRL